MISSFECERPAGATRALSTSTLEINTHGKAPQIQTDGQLIHRWSTCKYCDAKSRVTREYNGHIQQEKNKHNPKKNSCWMIWCRRHDETLGPPCQHVQSQLKKKSRWNCKQNHAVSLPYTLMQMQRGLKSLFLDCCNVDRTENGDG